MSADDELFDAAPRRDSMRATMAHARLARIFAPLAIVACVVAIVLVVSSTLKDDTTASSGGGSSATPTQTTSTGAKAGGRRRHRRPRAYTVKPGDILSTVAEQTGVTVERLRELNPEVDPNALQVGQKLKLRP